MTRRVPYCRRSRFVWSVRRRDCASPFYWRVSYHRWSYYQHNQG